MYMWFRLCFMWAWSSDRKLLLYLFLFLASMFPLTCLLSHLHVFLVYEPTSSRCLLPMCKAGLWIHICHQTFMPYCFANIPLYMRVLSQCFLSYMLAMCPPYALTMQLDTVLLMWKLSIVLYPRYIMYIGTSSLCSPASRIDLTILVNHAQCSIYFTTALFLW